MISIMITPNLSHWPVTEATTASEHAAGLATEQPKIRHTNSTYLQKISQCTAAELGKTKEMLSQVPASLNTLPSPQQPDSSGSSQIKHLLRYGLFQTCCGKQWHYRNSRQARPTTQTSKHTIMRKIHSSSSRSTMKQQS